MKLIFYHHHLVLIYISSPSFHHDDNYKISNRNGNIPCRHEAVRICNMIDVRINSTVVMKRRPYHILILISER